MCSAVTVRVPDIEVVKAYIANSAPTIVDAGASIGMSTLSYLQAFPKATIHCFEPGSTAFAGLEKNVREFRVRFPDAHIHANQVGLSDSSGTATFYQHAKSTMSSLNRFTPDSPLVASNLGKALTAAQEKVDSSLTAETFTKELPITLTDLDSYAEEHGIEHIDLLKIDVEGHEVEVLKGAQRLLAKGRVFMIFAELIFTPYFKDKEITFTAFEEQILRHHYRLAAILNPIDVTGPRKITMMDAIYTLRNPEQR